jgi:hypothetical protein
MQEMHLQMCNMLVGMALAHTQDDEMLSLIVECGWVVDQKVKSGGTFNNADDAAVCFTRLGVMAPPVTPAEEAQEEEYRMDAQDGFIAAKCNLKYALILLRSMF